MNRTRLSRSQRLHPGASRGAWRRCCRTSPSASAIRRACTASAARRARGSRPRASRSPRSCASARRRSSSPRAAPSPTTWRSRAWRWRARRGHLITSKIEHHAVLRGGAERSRSRASTVTYLPVDGDGLVDPDDGPARDPARHHPDLDHARQLRGRDDPARARRSGAIAREHGMPFHVDARADLRQAPDRRRRASASTCCRSPATRSTGRRAWPGSTSARAPRWSRSSTAASTSGAGARAPRTCPGSSGSARRSRSAAATWRTRRRG